MDGLDILVLLAWSPVFIYTLYSYHVAISSVVRSFNKHPFKLRDLIDYTFYIVVLLVLIAPITYGGLWLLLKLCGKKKDESL